MSNKTPNNMVLKAEKEILTSPKSALNLAEAAVRLIDPNDNKQLYLRAKYCICRSKWLLGDFTDALNCAGELIKEARRYKVNAFIAKGHHISGNVYIQMKSYPRALSHFFTALEYIEGCDDPETKSGLLNNIGEVYNETEDFEKAREYYLKCNEISKTLENKRNYGVSYLNLANITIRSGNPDKAYEYISKGKGILDAAEDRIGIAYAAMLEGDILAIQRKYDQAVENLKNAKKVLSESGDEFNIMWINEKILGIYRKTDNRDDYEELAKVSLDFARSIKSNEWISTFAFLLSEYYEIHKDIDKAYWYFKLGHRHKAFSYDEMLVQNKRNIEMFFEIKKAEEDKKVISSYNDQLERLNDSLRELSRLDGLTQIPNRRCFTEYLNEILGINCRTGLPICVLLIDIDHFKEFNDNYGHVTGDNVLKEVAGILKSCINRTGDIVARYGGDEFIALLPNTDVSGSRHVIEKVIAGIKKAGIQHAYSKIMPYLTVTIGGYIEIPDISSTIVCVVHNGVLALYDAKDAGRYCYVLKQASGISNPKHAR
ncbi:MAG: tetratricopeptide repeat-containing diguanylate cyclase, partial [Clostridia bacterium]|nr:tetratricopeptide repeat-containing diguanylate cyclase [Clostridia bacterium]